MKKSLPDPEIADVYVKLRTKLNDHFTPKKKKNHARHLFLKMRPQVGETTDAYAVRLREKAKECEVGDTFDERVLEHIVQTVGKIWDLTRFLTEARQTSHSKCETWKADNTLQIILDNFSRVYSEPLKTEQPANGFQRPVKLLNVIFVH